MCRQELVLSGESDPQPSSVVGDECHIISREPLGPRYDSTFPIRQLDSYDNLLLLCKVHHKQIDDQVDAFPAAELRRLKACHEAWVSSTLGEARLPDAEELVEILQERARLIHRNITATLGRERAGPFLARFDELHNKHIESLRRGQLIRAHELVREIHGLALVEVTRADGSVVHVVRPEPIIQYKVCPPPPPRTIQQNVEYSVGDSYVHTRTHTKLLRRTPDASTLLTYSRVLKRIGRDEERRSQRERALAATADRIAKRQRDAEIARLTAVFARRGHACPHCDRVSTDFRVLGNPLYCICRRCGRSFSPHDAGLEPVAGASLGRLTNASRPTRKGTRAADA